MLVQMQETSAQLRHRPAVEVLAVQKYSTKNTMCYLFIFFELQTVNK